MAEVKDNIITQGMSGNVGKQIVFKRYGNRTIVSKMPDMSEVKKSKKQQDENMKFREAAGYARSQMADPVSKAEYQAKVKGMQRAYNLAIADFYKAPEIRQVETRKFFSDKEISMIILDDFKVAKVNLIITDHDGVVLEEGEAHELGEWIWKYTTDKDYSGYSSVKILVSAWDKPGNLTAFETKADK
jgi:hypothetical protein